MQIQQIPTDSLIPYARNPRNNEKAVDKVAASLREFGWRQPIVVDAQMTVVAGHTRLLAAKKLGLPQVPVVVADDLTAEQVKAYRLADNRIAEESEWDVELLQLEVQELAGLEFDLEATGFDANELDRLLSYGGDGSEDEVPDLQDEAVTVEGDRWTLGRHCLLCGDATSAEDVERLLDGVKPTLMVTDPPYGVNYDPDWRNRADRANGKKIGARALGQVDNDDQADWRDAWALYPGDVAYVWHAANGLSVQAGMALEAVGFALRMQIIWSKSVAPIGRGNYHVQHEPCWYAVRKGAVGHWSGSRKETTVWNIDKPVKSETGHSTQKPVECMRRPIVNNTSPGQAVYDPFMGSGTTIIAGEKEGRPVYGIEINPLYVDVAVRRWQEYTGKDARLESGETFEEVENARRAPDKISA